MAEVRQCDICKKIIDPVTYKQFPPPSPMLDGKGGEAADSSMTDVCPTCQAAKGQEIINLLVKKADG